MFSPPLKKSIVFLKYALKMDLVKGEWFDLYHQNNDRAVMQAYSFSVKDMTESQCVAELMKMYQDLVSR